MTGDGLLRRHLRAQLSAYFPLPALEPLFAGSAEAPLLETTFRLVDAVVRQVAPAALEASHPSSAAGLKALAPVSDRASALKTMMAIEKVAHGTQGPGPFFRAIGGAPSASVLVADAEASGSEERVERAVQQVCGALVRVVGMTKQLGAAEEALLGPLRGALTPGA